MGKIQKVLIVEDNVTLNESLVFLIERLGVEALQAYDALEALEIIRGNEIDAVISDVTMPGMSGLELLREIKRFKQELPVIIMSGRPGTGLAHKAMQDGALGFLAKPIDDKMLSAILRIALEISKRAQVASQ